MAQRLFRTPLPYKPADRLSRFVPTKVTPSPGTKQEKAKASRLSRMKVTKVPMPWDEPVVPEPAMPWLNPKDVVDVSKLYSDPGHPYVYLVTASYSADGERNKFDLRWVVPKNYTSHLDDPEFKPELKKYIEENYRAEDVRIHKAQSLQFYEGPMWAFPDEVPPNAEGRKLTTTGRFILTVDDYDFSPRLPESVKLMVDPRTKEKTIEPVPQRCGTCRFLKTYLDPDGKVRVSSQRYYDCMADFNEEMVNPEDGERCPYYEVVPLEERESPNSERWKKKWSDKYWPNYFSLVDPEIKS